MTEAMWEAVIAGEKLERNNDPGKEKNIHLPEEDQLYKESRGK
jgi:hypothetical protein